MATVKFISKKPAGGAGNFVYTYACSCSTGSYSKNVTITAANDTEAHYLAEMECSGNCGESKISEQVIVEIEIPIKENNAEIEAIKNFKNDVLIDYRSYVNYSFYDQVYRIGDKLYGNWSQSLAGVCSGNTINGFFYNIQILKNPEVLDTCSGRYVCRIETID